MRDCISQAPIKQKVCEIYWDFRLQLAFLLRFLPKKSPGNFYRLVESFILPISSLDYFFATVCLDNNHRRNDQLTEFIRNPSTCTQNRKEDKRQAYRTGNVIDHALIVVILLDLTIASSICLAVDQIRSISATDSNIKSEFRYFPL